MNLRTIIKRVGIEDLRRILRQQPKLARLEKLELNATSSVPSRAPRV